MASKDPDLLKKLYFSALQIRIVEQTLADLYKLQEMRTPSHFDLGQEAIPAGVCECVGKDDHLFSTYRNHGWYLAKGGDMNRMVGELYGKVTGCSKGFGGSMHLLDLAVGFEGTTALVAAAIPHAVGAAFAFKYKKSRQVAISVFGDAATEEGIFHESAMFAILRKLPVVFICENNDMAVNSHIKYRQPPIPIHERTKALGMPTVLVDGNDAFQVYYATKEAVERARSGGGPTFIECTTYRILEHCGPNLDFGLGHRTEEEAKEWAKKDPIAFLEKQVDAKTRDEYRAIIKTRIDAAVAEARKAPFPHSLNPEDL
jgi:TPP-dependent pyruvate/acetoin dehydrogenase alpha subunit